MVAAIRKEERLEIRLTPAQKALFAKAAAWQGQTLTEFSMRSLQDSAEQALEKHQQIELDAQESQRFADALLKTVTIPSKLKEAFARHSPND